MYTAQRISGRVDDNSLHKTEPRDHAEATEAEYETVLLSSGHNENPYTDDNVANIYMCKCVYRESQFKTRTDRAIDSRGSRGNYDEEEGRI